MNKDPITTHRLHEVALATALVVGLVGGPAGVALGHRFLSSSATGASQAEAQARPEAEAERQAILRVVREHRRKASETWCATLAAAVHDEARRADVDPLLVTAIVARESSFHSRAVSNAGAVGLMQIRPFVARDVAAQHALEWSGTEMLHDPSINVRLGVTYYKQLLQRFDGDERKALTAYNIGPTRVSLAVRAGTYSANRYARDVLHLYERLAASRAAWAALGGVTLHASDPV